MPTLKEKEFVGTSLTDIRHHIQQDDLERLIILDIVSEISLTREDKEFSQRKLSELSGVPQKTISRIESGKDIPKIRTLMKLLNALDLDIEVVITPRK